MCRDTQGRDHPHALKMHSGEMGGGWLVDQVLEATLETIWIEELACIQTFRYELPMLTRETPFSS